MWQPEPEWVALPGGTGTSTLGVWRTAIGGRPVVVKRLVAPQPGSPPGLADPAHVAYWRREADVLQIGLTASTPGLRAAPASVEEDAEGITITVDWVEDAASSGLFLAMAIGRFAGIDLPRPAFLATRLLRDRLDRVAHRGGWPTLARTTVSDVADHLWRHRGRLLDLLDGLPQVAQHGDPTATNLPGREGDDAIAVDWGTLGTGPVGGDLGYLSLSAREELEPLLDAYLLGLPATVADRDAVLLGAQVVAVYTALSRAEWALARVAGGEGALAAKYRHPSVAPHLRALQRQFPAIEALLRV
ncbi:phosphotransferase [Nocardioides panacisoli]|uniref:Aminoglycoside phosphotransferase domain-containing protein n=1 Tax=Nocardioides panacisoli TaxID=627624 RepID=A0ABP7J1J2_9ACTN